MALGQQNQYIYSPDIVAYIKTVNKGIIDISEDIMSFTVDRRINQPSTAQIVLSNNGFKYTPGSKNDWNEPTVINTMDQIVISLKRETYYQVFTGFVTYCPVVTLIPQPITINCSCTLYKAENSYWDSGALDLQHIIPGILFDPNSQNSQTTYADGGIGKGIINVLQIVCNWNANDIRIGSLPQKWISRASDLYTTLIAKNQASTSSVLVSLTDAAGITSVKQQVSQTGGGSKGTSNAQVTFENAPAGTSINSTVGINAYKYKLSEITSNLDSSGVSSTKFGQILPNITGVTDSNFWVAIPFPYYTGKYLGNNSSSNPTTARSWISGGSAPDAYPQINSKPYSAGRLVWIVNPVNGAEIYAHAVFAIPSAFTDSTGIILSSAAFDALAGSKPKLQTSNNHTYLPVTIKGWVASNSTKYSLTGGVKVQPGAATTVDNLVANQTLNIRKGVSGQYLSPSDILTLLPQKNGQIDVSKLDSVTWCSVLLLAIGVPPANITVSKDPTKCSNNIKNLLAWMPHEGGFFMANLTPGTAYAPTPIGGGGGWNDPLGNPSGCDPVPKIGGGTIKFSYYDPARGIYQIAGSLLGSNYTQVVKALATNADVTTFCTALGSSPWQGGYTTPGKGNSYGGPKACATLWKNTVVFNNTSSNKPVAGTAGIALTGGTSAADQNFNTNNVGPGFNPAANLLIGSDRAFITDTQALGTISTLATTGLRSFQTAPNGDFLAWFPDYFGIYDTAPSLYIYAIEIVDLVIYHNDTQLHTHIGVSGDPSTFGSGVNIMDWINTAGIVTIQDTAILNLLYGLDVNDPNAISKYFPGLNSGTWSVKFMERYGMRPYVDEQPLIQSHLVEFMYAIQTFMYLWAEQYSTTITLTFMPEVYPGMLIVLPEYGLQLYVQAVSHQGDRSGGFSTQVTVTAPTKVVIGADGKVVPGTQTPVDFGYPWTPST